MCDVSATGQSDAAARLGIYPLAAASISEYETLSYSLMSRQPSTVQIYVPVDGWLKTRSSVVVAAQPPLIEGPAGAEISAPIFIVSRRLENSRRLLEFADSGPTVSMKMLRTRALIIKTV